MHTNKRNVYNIMNYKIHIKIHIKTFKTFLDVSILRSSSVSIDCFLPKLFIKTISELIRCINPMMWQHVIYFYMCSTLCRAQGTADCSLIVLINNYGKEQCMLLEDDLRIEIFRNILNVLIWILMCILELGIL
jgi:hypothetical protein